MLNRSNLDITQLMAIEDWAAQEAMRRGISPATASIQARSGKMDAGTVYTGRRRQGKAWFVHKNAIYEPQRGPMPRPHHKPGVINVVAASKFDDIHGSRGAIVREWVRSSGKVPFIESSAGTVYMWGDEDISIDEVFLDLRKEMISPSKAKIVVENGTLEGTRWQPIIEHLASGGTLASASDLALVTRERVRQILNKALNLASIGKTWQEEKRGSRMQLNQKLVARSPDQIISASQFRRNQVGKGDVRATTPLGKLLRDARTSFDLTLGDVSDATGVNTTVTNMAELGKAIPNAKNLFRLARFYEVPISELEKALFADDV